MRREPRALAEPVWDVLVVGGGIHGACVAWEAVLRGLTVCLVEQADFGSGTSASTMKIVHGGLRYLQHGDYRRMRESIRERRTLLRIAPHLVRPLPVLVPTHGHGWQGRPALRAALLLNDLVGRDRNAGLPAEQHIPRGRTLGRRDCLARVPGLGAEVTGAAVFHDAQVRSSERLLLAFLRSAAKTGAEIANYVEATALRVEGEQLHVTATDRLTGDRLGIRARAVVNAAGPWAEQVLGRAAPPARLRMPFAKAFNVVTRRLLPDFAVALRTRQQSRDPDSLLRRRDRMIFVVPWRDRSLVGTWYQPHEAGPDAVEVTATDVGALLQAVNEACPALALSLDDVWLVHAGLVPSAGTGPGTGEPLLAKRGALIDHAADGLPGLLTVVGVKFTTARLAAERAVDRVVARRGRPGPPSTSAVVPLHGAEPDALDHAETGPGRLRQTYGSAYGEVLAHLAPGEDPADASALLAAEVRHAIRDEMAQSLADVVFRRTELGAGGTPGAQLVAAAAAAAAAELGWSAERQRQEIGAVHARFAIPG